MSDDPIIQDTSRVDSYLRSRHRVEVLNSAWKPALAGAAGAVAVIGAVVLGVWIAAPRFTYREVEIPRVTMRDVTVPNIITKDIEIPIPRIVPRDAPIAANPPAPRSDAPKTPAEKKFVDKPEYKTATYRGRIVKSRDGGHELSFEDGRDFHPARWDDATGTVVYDLDGVIPSDEFVGDLGMCVPEKGREGMWDCSAMHDGVEVHVSGDDSGRPVEPQSSIGSTPTLDGMINIDVDLGYGVIKATVDTGSSWALALPRILADKLLKRGLAIRAGSSKSRLADGSVHEVDIIMLREITIEGHALQGVEASVSPSPAAMTLLGMAALNRLGPYYFADGRIVFTDHKS